jgi:6-phosphofructokinase 1
MNTPKKRIAIMVGAGFVPGMNAVIKGAALAAAASGLELVGIRDGFEGLLHPENPRPIRQNRSVSCSPHQ